MSVPQQELKRFGESTSIRGVPRIFKSNDIFLKVVWSLAVLTCTAVLVYLLVTLFQKFFNWPVATKYGENAAGKNLFPDITICSLNRFLTFLNDSKSMKKYFDNFSEDKKRNKSAAFDILNSVSGFVINNMEDSSKFSDCPGFISECNLYGENWQYYDDCLNNFRVSIAPKYYYCRTMTPSSLNIDKERFLRGITLVLNIGKQYEDQLPYDSTLTASQSLGAVISMHSPGTPPDMKTGIAIGPGTESVIKIVQTNVKRLDTPYNVRGCTNQKTMSKTSKNVYNFGLCHEHCFQNMIYEICGCTAHWLNTPESLNEAPLCGNITEALKSDVSDTFETKLLCALLITWYGDHCEECKQSCDELTYQYAVTSAPWPPLNFQLGVYRKYIKDCIDNFTEVKERYAAYDYFDKLQRNRNDDNFTANRTFKLSDLKEIGESLISVKLVMEDEKPFLLEDKPQYTWDVMISLVGGMLSLWLGISAMTIFEVFEFFYRSLKGCMKRKENPTNEMSTRL